jgi:hypothetical protein
LAIIEPVLANDFSQNRPLHLDPWGNRRARSTGHLEKEPYQSLRMTETIAVAIAWTAMCWPVVTFS